MHKVHRDLRRPGGSRVPAGEYAVRLQVGEQVLTKKFRVEAEP